MHGLFLQFAPEGVLGEPLDLFTQPIGVKLFHGIHDARVDVATAVAEHPTVGDVVGEGVLESVLQVGKQLCCIKKLGILQIAEQAAEFVLREPGNRVQQCQRDVVSDDRCLLQETLLGGGERVDAGGEHRLDGGRDLDARQWPRQPVVAARALEYARSTSARTISSAKNGFPLARSITKFFSVVRFGSTPNRT